MPEFWLKKENDPALYSHVDIQLNSDMEIDVAIKDIISSFVDADKRKQLHLRMYGGVIIKTSAS